jgi:hypothetical protein
MTVARSTVKSMLQYKINLEILNHRYTDIEHQLLNAMVRKWQEMRSYFPALCLSQVGHVPGLGHIRLYADMWWTVSNLLDDGLIEFRVEDREVMRLQEEQRNAKGVLLTEKGREFLAHWVTAEPL